MGSLDKLRKRSFPQPVTGELMLGYVTSDKTGATDKLMLDFARSCKSKGIRLAGAVQINQGTQGNHRSRMVLDVLGAENQITISQDLGGSAKGCRLDPGNLEEAVQAVNASMSRDTELLILNKFGKQERDGQGFRDVIVKALDLDIPVVFGVNASLLADFLSFAGDYAEQIPADLPSLQGWITTQIEQQTY